MRLCFAFVLLASTAFAADPQLLERGRKEEQRSCVQCHSLMLIDRQRISTAAWKKEIDKMIGWGAVVPDRELLLEYLSQEYSDSKPLPPPELSGNGSKTNDHH
jgi:hypothetical protein